MKKAIDTIAKNENSITKWSVGTFIVGVFLAMLGNISNRNSDQNLVVEENNLSENLGTGGTILEVIGVVLLLARTVRHLFGTEANVEANRRIPQYPINVPPLNLLSVAVASTVPMNSELTNPEQISRIPSENIHIDPDPADIKDTSQNPVGIYYLRESQDGKDNKGNVQIQMPTPANDPNSFPNSSNKSNNIRPD